MTEEFLQKLLAAESRRLRSGLHEKETPLGVGIDRIAATCTEGSDVVRARVREVFCVINQFNSNSLFDAESFHEALPKWFVDKFRPRPTAEQAAEEIRLRSLLPVKERIDAEENWIWWYEAWLRFVERTERQWFWWEGYPDDDDLLMVEYEVVGRPYPSKALKWIIRSAGGSDLL